jgi:hypothetical protein
MYIHHMAQRMVRKQVYLTAPQNERLRRAAKRLRRSEADLLREAIDRQLPGQPEGGARVEGDSLFRLVGVGQSCDRDLSDRVDEILYGRKRP